MGGEVSQVVRCAWLGLRLGLQPTTAALGLHPGPPPIGAAHPDLLCAASGGDEAGEAGAAADAV